MKARNDWLEIQRARTDGWRACMQGEKPDGRWPSETIKGYWERWDFDIGYQLGLEDARAPEGAMAHRGWQAGQHKRNSNKPHSVRRCP